MSLPHRGYPDPLKEKLWKGLRGGPQGDPSAVIASHAERGEAISWPWDRLHNLCSEIASSFLPASRQKGLAMTAAFDAVLFDIDNVLVDTRASYLTAIQKTVELYLNRPGVVSLREIERFKLLGGFNDDWDCSYGIITFLETAIQGKPIRFGDHRRQRVSIAELGTLFPERPLGLEGLLKRLQILYGRVETPSYRKVARIFQEVYLGKGLFRGPRLRYWKRAGLVQKEKLIFPKPLLQRIHKQGVRMGIVTGRNRFEAEYALKRFGIRAYFDALVTIDEVRKEEKKTGKLLRKPHPWPVLEAARRLRDPHPNPLPLRGRGKPACRRGRGEGIRFLYVGDLPDDVLSAQRAKKGLRIQSAAFPRYARDLRTTLQEFKKVKPDYFLQKPQDLLKILSS